MSDFTEGIKAAKSVVTDEMIEKVRDELAGATIGGGYYATSIAVDEAEELARMALESVAPLIAAQAWDQGHRAATLEWEHAYGHTVDPDDPSGMCTSCGQGNPYRTEAGR